MKRVSKYIALRLLWGYKMMVSPWLGAACRYRPTCSEYAIEAVEHYGAVRGTLMAGMRVLRCHPLAPGGYDPVAPNVIANPHCTTNH